MKLIFVFIQFDAGTCTCSRKHTMQKRLYLMILRVQLFRRRRCNPFDDDNVQCIRRTCHGTRQRMPNLFLLRNVLGLRAMRDHGKNIFLGSLSMASSSFDMTRDEDGAPHRIRVRRTNDL